MDTIGTLLEQIRNKRGLSTWEVEQQAPVSRRNLRAIEKGKRPPSDEVLKTLANLYSVPFSKLRAVKILSKYSPEDIEYLRTELCKC